MQGDRPHFLLLVETSPNNATCRGYWRFVLEETVSRRVFRVADHEPSAVGERLDLLATVRGLEALPQPARVTLVTTSRYVARGVKIGLPQWRANNWLWEKDGRYVPVRNADLWQRIDRALRYHEVECRLLTGLPEDRLAGDIEISSVRPTQRRAVGTWTAWLGRWVHRIWPLILPMPRAMARAG